MICDNETGQCIITPAVDGFSPGPARIEDGAITVHYVGDPMCSWCWGLAESVKTLETYSLKNGFRFVLTNGGLRAGGGDEWNDDFRLFLRNEWQHINQVTDQPFSYALLDKSDFNYDTEPACRAVVSASLINSAVKLKFFHETQRKFYTESEDPTALSFYKSICEKNDIDFKIFSEIFESRFSELETHSEFNHVRQFGVNSFPTILLEKEGTIRKVLSGYANKIEIIKMVEESLSKKY